MRLEERLQFFKLILSSYALFLVIAVSFARFTVPVPEYPKLEDVIEEASKKFLQNMFNETSEMCESIEDEMYEMHKEIILSMTFPIQSEKEIGVFESLQFVWNVFTTMGDPRLGESKILLTFVIGGFGIFIYFFNLLGWVTWFIGVFDKINESKYDKAGVSEKEQNRLLLNHRKSEYSREELLQCHDGIINDQLQPEQQFQWQQDLYYDYKNLTKINPERASINHSHRKKISIGFLLIPASLFIVFCSSMIFLKLFQFDTAFDSTHIGIASALTLDAPKGPAYRWWHPLIAIPLTFLAHFFVFATFLTLSQGFFLTFNRIVNKQMF